MKYLAGIILIGNMIAFGYFMIQFGETENIKDAIFAAFSLFAAVIVAPAVAFFSVR